MNSISPEINFLRVFLIFSIETLFCSPVFLFLIVASLFMIESLSVVMQNGVPISSFLAYLLPTDPDSSYTTFHSSFNSL